MKNNTKLLLKKVCFCLTILIIVYLIFNTNLTYQNERLMSLTEILRFNIKLVLISKAGLIDTKQTQSKILQILSNDEIMIKFHRELQTKYKTKYNKQFIRTYILTNDYNYYILDPELAKKILEDSPFLFSAGKIKEEFFNRTMPNNLGIAKCKDLDNPSKGCPWKNMRVFNENVLGTKNENNFFDCINGIVNRHITKPLLTINDFKIASNNIVCQTLFGENGENLCIFEKIHYEFINNKDVLKTKFYQNYKNHLHKSYKKAPKCSLNYLVNNYQNNNYDVIDDQIPHWTGPFRFIISYLIPNLLCIILNFDDIKQKLMTEFKQKKFDIDSKHSYLHYCVIEHIRMFNTININMQRTANKTMKYNGLNLVKGDQIFILFSSILRDPKLFSEPDNFKPERWVNKDIESQNIVFSVGPQQCPSKNITPLYYKTIIYRLLTKFAYNGVEPKLKSKKITYINPYDIKFY